MILRHKINTLVLSLLFVSVTFAKSPLSVQEFTTKPGINNSVTATDAEQNEVKFNAQPMENRIGLFWSLNKQNNTNYFIIERSNDGLDWTEVERTKAAEFCNIPMYYELYDDRAPNELCFYRIKIQYLDAHEEVSAVSVVDVSNREEYLTSFLTYKTYRFSIVYSGNIQDVKYVITDMKGQKVYFPVVKQEKNKIILDLKEAPDQDYTLTMKAPGGKEVENFIWIPREADLIASPEQK
jgi:hypothetical protein